jgi:hypothetical protein
MTEEMQLLAEIRIPACRQQTTPPEHYLPIRASLRPTMELMNDVVSAFDTVQTGM